MSGAAGRFADVADAIAGLRHAVASMQAQWPAGETFDGEDASGALSVTISSAGDVIAVRLSADWDRRLELRELARAVNQAAGNASARLAEDWIDRAAPREIPLGPRPSTQPDPSLDQYRARVPAPTSREDLEAKFALAAAARAEYRRYRDGLKELSRRDRFTSPARIFEVLRSRTTLLALETDRDRVVFQTPEVIADDITAALAEIRRRAADDQRRLDESMPALTEVREHTARRLAALRGGRQEEARA